MNQLFKNLVAAMLATMMLGLFPAIVLAQKGEQLRSVEKLKRPLSAEQEKLLNPSDDIQPYNSKEMMGLWKEFGQDKGWLSLLGEVKARGFSLGKDEKKMWGARGKVRLLQEDGSVNPKDRPEDIVFCIYDLEENKNGEKCSMLWTKRGKEWYKAYIVIPKGKGMEDGIERYAAADGTIKNANSWRRCFFRELKKICGPFCAFALTPCAIAAGASVGAAGVGAIASPAIFLGCMAASCGGCVAIVAAGCAAP